MKLVKASPFSGKVNFAREMDPANSVKNLHEQT
jgi:hypothetical protein